MPIFTNINFPITIIFMAIEIMQTLVELLCPTYNAQSACNAFINSQSHQVAQPIGPLLYFFFFPFVFLVLLIYIGTGIILKSDLTKVKGLRLLVAIAFFIYIVLQGLYPAILWISDFWFFMLPLLFIIYFIFHHKRGGSAGGGGSLSGTGGGFLGAGKSRLMRTLTGEIPDLEKTITSQLDALEAIRSSLASGNEDIDTAHRAYVTASSTCTAALREMRTAVELGSGAGAFSKMKVGGNYDRLLKRFEHINKDLMKAFASHGMNIKKTDRKVLKGN